MSSEGLNGYNHYAILRKIVEIKENLIQMQEGKQFMKT